MVWLWLCLQWSRMEKVPLLVTNSCLWSPQNPLAMSAGHLKKKTKKKRTQISLSVLTNIHPCHWSCGQTFGSLDRGNNASSVPSISWCGGQLVLNVNTSNLGHICGLQKLKLLKDFKSNLPHHTLILKRALILSYIICFFMWHFPATVTIRIIRSMMLNVGFASRCNQL